jgi:hypothetical protein
VIATLGFLVSLLFRQDPPGAVAVGNTNPFQDRRIRESSGVVASRTHRGLLWTLNDSGGEPVLFLTDTAGAALGSFRVTGAVNLDWEALGRGRCGTTDCLYIGDTGDNRERRRAVTLYRVPEPEPLSTPGEGTAAGMRALQVEYPDGSHDVEAIYAEPDGGVVLITTGRSGGIWSYRVAASAWQRAGIARAERLDSLPIPVSLTRGRAVTDAALSPDGAVVVVRTYRDLWFFSRTADGRLRLDSARPMCPALDLQLAGEAVDWWDARTLVLTSERGGGRAGTILLARCPGR